MNPFAQTTTQFSSPREFLRRQSGYYSINEIASGCNITPDVAQIECEKDPTLESRLYNGKLQFRVARPQSPAATSKRRSRSSSRAEEKTRARA